ncbi:peptidylprolyl isomerase A [Candidatus Marinamargulisbacteria bacterium SCGC AAA071-K20]|nr:peptidylprolyl isomerase A [Candidatus Marinamargulisbacteria bacterium SCGC AAA071-K20]
MKRLLLIGLVLILGFSVACKEKDVKKEMAKKVNPVVKIETTMGDIYIELFKEEAPISVKNFMDYASDGFYNGTVFHRVINGFMIQGGGFLPGMEEKETNDPIKNEANNNLSNKRGTVAMARTNVVDSATAQFFVNLADNTFLDHKSDSASEYGYAVFGKVIQGMDVVDAIKGVETTRTGYYSDVPAEDVIIKSAAVSDDH